MSLKNGFEEKKEFDRMTRQELQTEILHLRELKWSAKRSLQLDETRLRAFLATSPIGLGRIMDKRLCWVNKALCSMTGYTEKELVEKKGNIFYSDEQRHEQALSSIYNQINHQGKATIETEIIRKNGTILECVVCASLFRAKDPSLGIIITLTDISEIRNLERQLKNSQKMEALGILAGIITHDFNNILMGIQGHTSIIKSRFMPSHPIYPHIDAIETHLKNAATLTGRILSFARKGNSQTRNLDLGEIVSKTLGMFSRTRNNVSIHENHEQPLWKIQADKSQLEQVMLNLFINAWQAMPKGGELFVNTENISIGKDHNYPFEVTPGNYVHISIRDTGIGMEPEVMARVFEPFFTTKQKDLKEGTGLGLASVYEIMKNHHGFILVESEVGKGSTFKLYFPAD